ncbi:unnamed protein product [Coregonus sp. 'balchen']|nr:unnamed protein product [Coregonus sp. 'balchen']
MSHYNNSGGCNNLAYHDSDTLEIDRRKSQSHHSNPHGNPYPRDDGAVGQRGRSDLQQLPGGGQSSYDEAQGRVPWGGWQEGSWRGRDSIPMGLLPPRSESPQWQQHDLSHVSMRFRGSRRMSLFPVGEAALGNLGLSEDDIRNEMENEEQNLVKELVAMSTRDRIKAIRDLPMSFDDKKHIRCGANMTLARQTLELWRGTMKEVGGKFGTGVLSYFKFLKWLLMFNIFSFLVNFGFITIPQLIYDTKPDIPSRVSFKGLEILTGAGYFSDTVMYYGGYSNETQGTEGWSEYNMQLAYFFTIAAYMVLCGAALIYSMASSFRKKYVLADSGLGGAWQLLCSWDFSVTNERAVRQRKNNLRIQLKESLSEKIQVALLPLTERLKHYGVFLASGSLLDEAATLLLPFVVSLINLVIPLCYSLFKKIEHYSNPRMQVYAMIVRNVILKMSILGILCHYWMKDVANTFSCWESRVGQALYRLVIMDFLFIMLGSFFGEFLSNVIGTKCIQSLGVPEFDVARNVLDLIYAQTLAWIGIYFSPLLPVIQIIKFFILFYLKKVTCSVWFFILFYLKKVSLTQNCQPPRRAGRAAQMQTIFIAILFFPSFVGALSMVAYTVWTLPPSKDCGPFRGLNTTFSAVQIWMDGLEGVAASQWTVWIYQHVIRSEIFYFLVSLITLVFIYVFRQITQGRKLLIILLRQQIVNKSKQNKPKKKKQVRKRQENESSTGMLQALLARQRLEQEDVDSSSSFGVPMPSDHSVSTTSSAMIQAMLARKHAEDQDVASYRGVPFPADPAPASSSALIQAMQARQHAEDQDVASYRGVPFPTDPAPASSSALIQAMQARQMAESQNEDEFYRAPVQSQNPVNALPSTMIQVMQARQRAESQQGEDEFYRAPVHSEHPVSSTSSAMMQVMQARQRAEEEESEFYRAPASSQHPDASGSGSALIQAMLARQQVEEEYGDRY